MNTLQELIAYGKANPGKLTFATQGPTSTAHLSAAQLEVLAGIKMLAVPYRGAQPALTDVIAGNVDMFFDTLATSVPLHRGGKLKILAVADLQRAKTAPDLPTFSEAGMPGFRSITWFGLVAPPGRRPRWRSGSTATLSRCCAAPRSVHGCRACRSRPARPALPRPRRSSPAKPRLGQGHQGSRHQPPQ